MRLLAQIGKANIVVTARLEQIVSLYLRNTSNDDMIRNSGQAAWYRYDTPSKTYIIMSGDEYQKDLAIVRDEQTQVFTLRLQRRIHGQRDQGPLWIARVEARSGRGSALRNRLAAARGRRPLPDRGVQARATARMTRSSGGLQSSGASGEQSSSSGSARGGAGTAYDPSADPAA